MKRLLQTSSTLLFIITILFANPNTVLANEGDGGHQLELEVNGYHVILASQNDWGKGANNIIVTLTDGMGMPVSNADVKILITPKADGHAEAEMDSAPGMDMGTDPPQESVPGMDTGMPATAVPGTMTKPEETASPISMTESDEQGTYMVETHFESSGKHDVHVMFNANGEMLQADFIVEVAGTNSKNIVLWGFAAVNVAFIAAAGVMKRKPILVKGGK